MPEKFHTDAIINLQGFCSVFYRDRSKMCKYSLFFKMAA